MNILKIHRITDKDIPEVDEQLSKVNTEYKGVRKYFYSGERVKYIQVNKYDDGSFRVDITYQEVKEVK